MLYSVLANAYLYTARVHKAKYSTVALFAISI